MTSEPENNDEYIDRLCSRPSKTMATTWEMLIHKAADRLAEPPHWQWAQQMSRDFTSRCHKFGYDFEALLDALIARKKAFFFKHPGVKQAVFDRKFVDEILANTREDFPDISPEAFDVIFIGILRGIVTQAQAEERRLRGKD